MSEALNRVRGDAAWLAQSDMVANSPQALLPNYVPIMMSKLKLTRDASRWNPFNTDGFLWLDGIRPVRRSLQLHFTSLYCMTILQYIALYTTHYIDQVRCSCNLVKSGCVCARTTFPSDCLVVTPAVHLFVVCSVTRVPRPLHRRH
jgi:hypothetical protein